jgi:alkylated DNA nucleotide flippase Atl1
MTVANAVEEAARQGKDMRIPYWRTLKAHGFLNEKYPGGIRAHGRLLEKEGFKIVQNGKHARIQDHSDFLAFEA